MSNTPSAHTRSEHTEWPGAVTPYPVLKRGCGVRLWAVASLPRPSRARRATSLAKPGYACTVFSGRASLPVGSQLSLSWGRWGNASGPASGVCGAPGPRLPSGWVGMDSGNPCPCGHVAAAQPWSLKQASGNRVGARCTYSGFLGLPSLSFWRNRSVPVVSFAQKPKPWQSPPSPAHSAASGTIFQVVPKNSFLSSVCLSGESRAVPGPGVAGAPGATGWRPPGEPGRRSACPRRPFRPSLRGGSGGFRAVPTAPHRFDGVG